MTLLIHAGLLLAAVGLTLGLARASRALTIPALLVAGVAVGPHGLGLLTDGIVLDAAGDLGLSLLLFYTALLARPDAIKQGGRLGATLAAYDLIINFAAAWWVGALFGLDLTTRLLLAGVMATSSTGVALKIFGDEGKIRSREGQVLTAVMWIEDMAFVAYFVFVTGHSNLLATGGALEAVVSLAGFAALLLAARLGRHAIWRIRSLELLVPLVTGIGLVAAGLGGMAGLPPAGAAFTAGLVLGSPRARRLVDRDAPYLREASAAVFFLAFGATIDPTITQSALPLAATAAAAILATDLLFLPQVARLLGLRLRESLTVGSSLIARGGKSVSFARIDAGVSQVVPATAGILALILTPLAPFLVRLTLAAGKPRRTTRQHQPAYRELVSRMSRRVLIPHRFHQRDLAPFWRRLETAQWVLLPLLLAVFASLVPHPWRIAPIAVGLLVLATAYHATRRRVAEHPASPTRQHDPRRHGVPPTERFLPVLLHAPALLLFTLTATSPWLLWSTPIAVAGLFLTLLLLPIFIRPGRVPVRRTARSTRPDRAAVTPWTAAASAHAALPANSTGSKLHQPRPHRRRPWTPPSKQKRSPNATNHATAKRSSPSTTSTSPSPAAPSSASSAPTAPARRP